MIHRNAVWISAIYCLLFFVGCVYAGDGPNSVPNNSKEWPDVLVIDNFENGIGQWENQDSGQLAISKDAETNKQSLLWTAADDSIGEIVFKNLSRDKMDFSQYDLMTFRVKIEGKPIWNLGLVLQQYPAVYGFQGLYYSIDTLCPFDKWFTFTQDLSRWENVAGEFGKSTTDWKSSFDTNKQDFRFRIEQLAGSASTRVYLSDIRLFKNPLGLKPSYAGTWSRTPDGAQTTRFGVVIRNKKNTAITAILAKDSENPGTLQQFSMSLSSTTIHLAPGEEKSIEVQLTAPPAVIANQSPWYGEYVRLSISVKEIPGLTLYTQLTAGTKPNVINHPLILCDESRMMTMQQEYADIALREKMSPDLIGLIKAGEKALAYTPEYPPLAVDGITHDPVSGGALQKISVPNLPFDVYQDPISGRSYSGPLYDAGMKKWKQKHLQNAEMAKTLALAYLVSGRKEFAISSANILRAYIDAYLKLPLYAYRYCSPVGSACSGSVRIEGTFMRERIWLSNLALALDCIIPAEVLSKNEINEIGSKVFSPSAMNMMDHEVGVMNLQLMIDSSSLYAGLAAELPDVVTRAVWGSHGVDRVFKAGYLSDGNWWENPSYQNVMNLCAFPVFAVGLRNGIFHWNDDWKNRLTASYRMNGPDRFSPELGTGMGKGVQLENTFAHVLAPIIPDPELAWMCYNGKLSRAAVETYLMAILTSGKPLVPEDKAVSPVASSTVNFTDYGGVAMRIPDTDSYAYIHYGREVTHGHRNKLSVHAYGKGGWYMRNVMGGYVSSFKTFLETVTSASTIMVDGMNARHDTGELLCLKTEKDAVIVSAQEHGAWPDVAHERTVVLTKGPLIIVDRCKSDNEHTYDWLYYATPISKLKFASNASIVPAIERFGSSPAFSVLFPVAQLAIKDQIVWTRADTSGAKISCRPQGDLYLTRVEGPTKPDGSGFGDNRGLLWRQRGKTVFFVTALWPFAKGEDGDTTIKKYEFSEDNTSAKVIVSSPEGEFQIHIRYTFKGNDRVELVK